MQGGILCSVDSSEKSQVVNKLLINRFVVPILEVSYTHTAVVRMALSPSLFDLAELRRGGIV